MGELLEQSATDSVHAHSAFFVLFCFIEIVKREKLLFVHD